MSETATTDRARAPKIHFPTEEEKKAVLTNFFAEQNKNAAEGRAAVEAAIPALDRLCAVMQGRSEQPYKVRELLYSLYNGQPASLLEVVGLDRAIRADFCAVLLAFGFEETRFVGGVPQSGVSFFYAEMKAAIEKAGVWDWFIAAHKDEEAA